MGCNKHPIFVLFHSSPSNIAVSFISVWLGLKAVLPMPPMPKKSNLLHISSSPGPDKKKVPITLDKLETGLYRAKYRPVMVGTHTVTVTQKKQPITKQPWTVQVFDPLQVKIMELSDALCHRAASFKGKYHTGNRCNLFY
jgi:Filamin/ABP280 repeat.